MAEKSPMTIGEALKILDVKTNFTREDIKRQRDFIIKKNKEKNNDKIKEAYHVLKTLHREKHPSTYHNRFTNVRKGIYGLASRMFTRRTEPKPFPPTKKNFDTYSWSRYTSGIDADNKYGVRHNIRDKTTNRYSQPNNTSGHSYGHSYQNHTGSRSRASAPRNSQRYSQPNNTPGASYQNHAGSRSRSSASPPRGWANHNYGHSSSRKANDPFSRFGNGSSYFNFESYVDESIDKEIDKNLKILGLPLTSESFNRRTIILAYRAKALVAHPNKGGNKRNFHHLTDAKDALIKLLDNNQ